MKQQLSTAISIIAISALVFSCGKDDKKATPTPTPSSDPKTLILGEWKAESFTSDVPMNWWGNGVLTTNGFAGIPACNIDNIAVFYANGDYQETEGATKCNPNDPDISEEGTWNLENYPTLIWSGETFTIAQLDDTALKITYTNITDTITAHVTFYYKR